MKTTVFVCVISGLNHSYASVSQHGVNGVNMRGGRRGWHVKQALILILSHFVLFVSVFLHLTLTLSQRENGVRRFLWAGFL